MTIPLLPLKQDVETKAILKKVAKAHQALAELKGVAKSIPNEAILVNTLSLQEAKESSAIENIITTHDELYQSNALTQQFVSIAAKEVFNYSKALQYGFQIVKETGILTNSYILRIQSEIEGNNAGFRKLPGTALKNQQTGEVVYMPPQDPDEIVKLMDNLEQFINDNELSDLDPLVKMAVIHHQFESIHPFYDGNGRTGRIINILYLVKQDLLNLPILYLSRYINLNKKSYYELLQEVRDSGNWENWILFILEGIESISRQTIVLLEGIKAEMQSYKNRIRLSLPKTASKYLNELEKIGLISKVKLGKENYYVNSALFQLLSNVNSR
ncbi:Fic family protein [Dyadobacter sp. 3J3]|uniref:Fic family protein n=1 Tax=Dyadobacter sp. 3J3 TaxID=2606600 RepID=UPI00190F41A4|nr:Fic family protein [Dyadobacter sp. 3J3]